MLVLFIALLVACGPVVEVPQSGTAQPEATEQPAMETPEAEDGSDAIAATAAAFLAQQLGIAEDEIEVTEISQVEFSDSCLGLGGPAESCLQAITPGWLVLLRAGDREYEVHTDLTGEQVRVAADLPVGDGASDPAVGAAQEFMAAELGVALGDVQVVSVEAAEFSDACLGLGGPDELCAQVITPGWIVMVDVDGQMYEIHTDQTGQQVRLAAEAPEGDSQADAVAAAAQEFLAAELGVALGDVQVVSVEPVEFSDSCLGYGGPDESCLQAITPGWVVMLEVDGQPYEAHTDETGQQVRLAPSM
jgi:hypothetical protein